MRVRDKRRGLNAALEQVPAVAEAAGQQLVRGGTLVEFAHGLGDLVQFGAVLAHLKDANPALQIDVAVADEKVLSATGFERRRLGFNSAEYRAGGWDQCIRLDFPDCHGDIAGFPATKTYRCVTEFFRLAPRPELFCYRQPYGADAKRVPRNISPHCRPGRCTQWAVPGRMRALSGHVLSNAQGLASPGRGRNLQRGPSARSRRGNPGPRAPVPGSGPKHGP